MEIASERYSYSKAITQFTFKETRGKIIQKARISEFGFVFQDRRIILSYVNPNPRL